MLKLWIHCAQDFYFALSSMMTPISLIDLTVLCEISSSSHTSRKFSTAGILDFKMKNLLVKKITRDTTFLNQNNLVFFNFIFQKKNKGISIIKIRQFRPKRMH